MVNDNLKTYFHADERCNKKVIEILVFVSISDRFSQIRTSLSVPYWCR